MRVSKLCQHRKLFGGNGLRLLSVRFFLVLIPEKGCECGAARHRWCRNATGWMMEKLKNRQINTAVNRLMAAFEFTILHPLQTRKRT